MEFPNLGQHCSEASCRQLDYLPLKCDACEKIYCREHINYNTHNCPSAYKKDVQVPVCPLCNTPIPVKRGEPPDIAVGAHIDSDCQSDPAKSRRKIFTNKCSARNCHAKEVVPVVCGECKLNFCLKHRHPVDHQCKGAAETARRRAMEAAMMRQAKQRAAAPDNGNQSSQNAVDRIQGGLSEDEALARALQLSLEESQQESTSCSPRNNHCVMS